MATINAQHLQSQTAKTRRILWETMGNADSGSPILIGECPDGSIQVVGTFGGATIVLQGSNDGTNWVTLTDEIQSPVSFTSAGLKMFLPRVWKIRPTTSGGTGTDLDVYVILGS